MPSMSTSLSASSGNTEPCSASTFGLHAREKFKEQEGMALPSLALVVACAMVVAMAHSTLAQNSPQDYVDAHNKARREEPDVGPVSWNATVAAYAENYANKLKRDCTIRHSHGPYGENLFWGSGKEYTAADAVKMWVEEKDWYHYFTNTCERWKVCGHYTQVVWRDSTQIGCARVMCPTKSRGIIITCNYYPPGNIEGERPFGEGTLAWHAQ